MIRLSTQLIGSALFVSGSLVFAHTPGESAKVYFKNIQDGDTIGSPYLVEFGIEDYGIVPAGTKDKRRHTAGHHHLLVDHPGNPALDKPIPHNKFCMHFDEGEVSAELKLPPGKHTLQLLLGDETHEPTDPPLFSPKITVTVE
jgi:hypothetical protein